MKCSSLSVNHIVIWKRAALPEFEEQLIWLLEQRFPPVAEASDGRSIDDPVISRPDDCEHTGLDKSSISSKCRTSLELTDGTDGHLWRQDDRDPESATD